jgi:hypothetical protein
MSEINTHDAAMQQWQQLSDQVNQMVEKAAADPAYLAGLGLSLRKDSLGITGRTLSENPKADLLRACAEKVIPAHFDWEVLSAIGGNAYLMLRAIRPIHTPLRD